MSLCNDSETDLVTTGKTMLASHYHSQMILWIYMLFHISAQTIVNTVSQCYYSTFMVNVSKGGDLGILKVFSTLFMAQCFSCFPHQSCWEC